MLKTITTAFLCIILTAKGFSNDYQDAWEAIRSKDFKTAKEALLKATQNPATATDAYLTLLYLQTYEGKETKIDGLKEALLNTPDKNAYAYALWFNGAFLGNYNKKQSYQLDNLNTLISNNSFNGSMQAAAHYVKGMHYIFSHEFEKAKSEWAGINADEQWEITGPFENISGSGFNNNNGPITVADDNATFKGLNNIDVKWFVPSAVNAEGWMTTSFHILQYSAIVYAQSFVYAPEDMKVMLNAGCNGSLKVWVNDGAVLSESKERVTEIDYYKNYCTLKKGYNRVLVQLGYTTNSTPNFIIRFTDENLNPVKGLTYTNHVQPYTKGPDASSTQSLRHFAEEFFEKKIQEQPSNLLNYILLAETYLRDERTAEVRQIIEKALKISPDNPLLKLEDMQSLVKSGNHTALLEEVSWLKENDPTSYVNYQIEITNLINQEKYNEADEELTKMKDKYGEDQNITQMKIQILAKLGKVEELVKLIQSSHAAHPDNTSFLSMMFRVKKQVEKDAKGAIDVYEQFLKTNYNYEVFTSLADEYKEQGNYNKYAEMLKELYTQFPYDPRFATDLSTYYFEKQDYAKSLEYSLQALKLAPYTGKYWENAGTIQQAMHKDDDAIASLKKAIYYNRTNYDARKKLITLQKKTDLYKLLPDENVDAIVKKAPADEKYDYSFLLDNKGTIIYDEGASEEYTNYIVKLYSQKGIDTWKEVYLNYNDDNQELLVEKVEVIKANGTKVTAERDGTHVVFTGLEPGDAIHVQYRVQNYYTGRLAREFYDKYNFNYFVPSASTKYMLIVPKNYKFNVTMQNGKSEPVVKDVDDYKMYTWQAANQTALKTEPFMPPLNDVGNVLHISTLKSWADVANWYSDLCYQNLSNNFELNAAYDEIFSKKKAVSEYQKAKLIYEYILNNIRYSSVSFRQSGLVPQDISKIITTKLGDCKDLSSLFVALADKAGIHAQLVLIDTRDNGSKDMVLPSMSFNHCIVFAKLDGKDYYLELTDNNMPFGSLPNNLNGALSLLIPPHGQKATEDLKPLIAINKTRDVIARKVNVAISGKDEKISMDVQRTGSLTSGWRDEYGTLSEEKQSESFEQSISNGYKNPVKLESLSFTNLKNLSDSLRMQYKYTVKNEVIEAGSMKMIKIPFTDVIATMDNFSSDKRDFPIEYWNYENTDAYETEVNIELPAGQKFMEIPESQKFTFKNSTYSIQYVKQGEKLKIIRSVKLQRDNVSSTEYVQFKKFFNDIVDAESKYLVFK